MMTQTKSGPNIFYHLAPKMEYLPRVQPPGGAVITVVFASAENINAPVKNSKDASNMTIGGDFWKLKI